MRNELTGLNLEFHIIQSFPTSCLNRDESGAPKTAVVGGVERARVSSQAWKRVVRTQLSELGLDLSVRTKSVANILTARFIDKGVELEKAQSAAEYVVSKIAQDTLLFISDKELKALVEFCEEREFQFDSTVGGSKKTAKSKDVASKVDPEKAIAKILKNVLDEGLNAVDIALFGRMVAKINDINVEAATSFSNAISTHRVENEIDFFTGMDDLHVGNGASHIGDNLFNSATYYRYINLNLGQLVKTLYGFGEIDREDLNKILKVFIQALYLAVPNARQNSQAAYCAWDYAQILLRKGQQLQVCFDTPVSCDHKSGYSAPSIEKLKHQISRREKLSGSLYGLKNKFEFGEDEDYSLDNLISDVQEAVGACYA